MGLTQHVVFLLSFFVEILQVEMVVEIDFRLALFTPRVVI